VGFCEAVLLALLGQEQWGRRPAKQRRKEIYVLITVLGTRESDLVNKVWRLRR